MNNVTAALQQLETYNKNNGITVYVPSLKREVKFKNLTLLQQKGLLKSSIEESLTKLSFIVSICDILKQNNLDTSIDIDTLFVFDRIALSVTLRSKCLDNNYTTGENGKIDLNVVVENYKNIPLIDLNDKNLEHENFSITVTPPRVLSDKKISEFSIKKIAASSDKDLKSILSELFVYELVKFIKTFTIKDVNTTIDFTQITAEERVKLAEQLPSQLVTKLLEYIKTYRDFETKFTTTGEHTIDVDGSFFTI
jgi:hypothetical protein